MSILIFDTENDIENACDGKTHIQTAHPKRKCNRPLNNTNTSIQREHFLNHFFADFFVFVTVDDRVDVRVKNARRSLSKRLFIKSTLSHLATLVTHK
jgi:hypothetical protein